MAVAQVANIGSTGVVVSVTIADGATESDEIATGGMVVWAVQTSAAWTAATLTFKQGHVAGTRVLVSDGVTAATNYTVQTTQAQWSPVDPAKGIGAAGFVSIVTSAAQAGGDTLFVLLRYI